MRSTTIPVRNQPHHQPKYLLILFSADKRAHWDFADQASKAHIDWLHHCSSEDYQANVSRLESQGVSELFPKSAPTARDVDLDLKRDAAKHFSVHLSAILESAGSIRPIDAIAALYGSFLGRAGAPHMRQALKELHAAGQIDDGCVGDYWDRTITWTGDAKG